MDLATHPDASAYGRLDRRSPLVRRLLARNPSAFTFTGTGTFVVGTGTVAVIDPGPDDPDHVAALIAALEGETVSHIVITHTHRDHSPAAPALQAATGAKIVGCAPLVLADDGPRADAGFDPTYAPDQVLAAGDSVSGGQGDGGWTLTAVHTPGHTSNHLCYALPQEKALFTGDHVMGWSTTVVAPPDGDMAAYMASLRLLLDRDDEIYHPTHGEPVTDPQRFVRGLITHRKQRENQILKLLGQGPQEIPAMVAVMYAQIDKRLHPAAGRSVLAHLIDLKARGIVADSGADWRLVA
jgi:glyoxylase-like metal-dependent hydrolase (beta-lactamase superfamily II)